MTKKSFSVLVFIFCTITICRSAPTFEEGIFRLDTALYETKAISARFYIGPDDPHAHRIQDQSTLVLRLNLYRRKGSEQYDLISFSGTEPSPANLPPEI